MNRDGLGWSRLRRSRLWAQALRVHFFTASLIPVLIGTIVARNEAPIAAFRFILVLMGVFSYHGGANIINDLYDETTDGLNRQPSLFNGGSRVLPDQLVSARLMRKAALFCYGLGTACALVLAFTGGGFGVLLLALAGIGCGYFYSVPPIRLEATGFGEICVGLAFGPFLVVGTAAAFTGRFLPEAFLVSLPVGALITAVILINELPDYESDRQGGKRTLVVRLGQEQSSRVLAVLLGIAFLLLFIIFLTLGSYRYLAVLLLILPLAFWVWLRSRCSLDQSRRIIPACAGMILLHLAGGLVLIIALVNRGR